MVCLGELFGGMVFFGESDDNVVGGVDVGVCGG